MNTSKFVAIDFLDVLLDPYHAGCDETSLLDNKCVRFITGKRGRICRDERYGRVRTL